MVNMVPAGPEGGVALTGTEIVPTIPRLTWKLQWYVYLPAAVNANENVPPGASVPESHVTGMVVSAVVVWFTVPVFVHSAVLPCCTLALFGEKKKVPPELVAWMLTVAASAEDWVRTTSKRPRGTALRAIRSMRTPFVDGGRVFSDTGECAPWIGAGSTVSREFAGRPPASQAHRCGSLR